MLSASSVARCPSRRSNTVGNEASETSAASVSSGGCSVGKVMAVFPSPNRSEWHCHPDAQGALLCSPRLRDPLFLPWNPAQLVQKIPQKHKTHLPGVLAVGFKSNRLDSWV